MPFCKHLDGEKEVAKLYSSLLLDRQGYMVCWVLFWKASIKKNKVQELCIMLHSHYSAKKKVPKDEVTRRSLFSGRVKSS